MKAALMSKFKIPKSTKVLQHGWVGVGELWISMSKKQITWGKIAGDLGDE